MRTDLSIKDYVKAEKEALKKRVSTFEKTPKMAIVKVGHDVGSDSYVKGKVKDATEVGMIAEVHQYDGTINQETLMEEVRRINEDPSVDGLIVQLPLPKHIKETEVTALIDPHKDIDGFLPNSPFIPCTPRGIVDYLEAIGFVFQGRNALVIGRSGIVGKPLAKLLLSKNMNVTVTHSKTTHEDMDYYTRHADLIAVATGKAGLLDNSYHFKEDAVVVDVGISRGEDGHLHGDAVPGLPVALQTPVPGGVGLVTRLSLLKNVLEAYEYGLLHR